ncbi:MAG: hypothetical protein HQ565_13440 [Bacteroidetes bacterium]|nr:hypothetical protein [Bacteroidota bacterium]
MTSNIEYIGRWKLPHTSEWINGTLSFNPETGANLELFGTFDKGFHDMSTKPIIHGETNIGEITLFDNWFITAKYQRNGVTIGIYEPILILIGQHFGNVEEAKFRNVRFSAFNLFQWFSLSGINQNFSKSGDTYSINYNRLNEINFELNQNCYGNISFDSPVEITDVDNKIDIREQCYVSLSYIEKTPFEDILIDVKKFIGLITLFTFEQSYPLNIAFQDADIEEETECGKRKKTIKIIYHYDLYSPKYKIRRKHQHLVKYQDIAQIFPNVIKSWFERFNELEPVFSLMLYSFKDKNRFRVEKFMDIVRAIETFHRRTHNSNRLPIAEYDQLVNSILSDVKISKEDKEWLENKLRYGNEPTLHKRIKEMINQSNTSILKDSSGNIRKFCQRVVDSRNYYTHYDESLVGKALTGKELFNVNQKLMVLLVSNILDLLEIDLPQYESGLNYLFQ